MRRWSGAEIVRVNVRRRVGPKLMNRCRPEQKGTKELGKMLRMIKKSQEGENPDREGQGSIIEGVKTRLWNIAKKSMLADRGALLEDGGDLVREWNGMHA